MIKTKKDVLVEIFDDWHKEVIDQGFKISELFDKVIVWLVGLATGAIVLIFSSLDKLTFFSKTTLNTTLFFLVSSVILGVLGRIFYAIAVYLGYYLSAQFSIRLKMHELQHDPRKLEESDTSEDVYEYFREDFKVEVPSILEYKNNMPETDWHMAHKYARDLYGSFAEVSRLSIVDSLKVIHQITTESFGYRDGYFERYKNSSNRRKGIAHRIFTYSSYLLYILSALNFGIAFLYFYMQYVNSK